VFGAPGVLLAFASIVDQPRTRSVGFVVVTLALQAATPPWVVLALASSGVVGATPVKDEAAISPCVTEPEKVAVKTCPTARPTGAGAEAIAIRKLLVFLTWASTVHVRPPPVTEVSVRVELFHTT
jgi:hypothetical protein